MYEHIQHEQWHSSDTSRFSNDDFPELLANGMNKIVVLVIFSQKQIQNKNQCKIKHNCDSASTKGINRDIFGSAQWRVRGEEGQGLGLQQGECLLCYQ